MGKNPVFIGSVVYFCNMSPDLRYAEACRVLLSHDGSVVVAGEDPSPPPRSFHPNDHRLLGCVQGRLRLRFGSSEGACERVLSPGDLAFIPADCWFSHHDTRACVLLNLAWRPEGLDGRLRRCRTGAWENISTGLVDARDCPPAIQQTFRLCAAIAVSSVSAVRHACRCLLTLLEESFTHGLVLRPYHGGRQDLRWLQLRDAVAEHLGADLSRDHLAAVLGVHPNHVSRMCAREGRRFVEVVHEERLRVACHLLANDDLTIDEVARRCGFGSSHYFHRVFRKQVGCSPGVWRTRSEK
jgi:AraC-like DNA-binding protein